MRRSSIPLVALLLAVSGCATTNMSGEYRPHSSDEVTNKAEKRVLGKGGKFLFFWGLATTRDFDVDAALARQLRDNEVVTGIEIEDHLSIGGAFLWLITAGIVSHHSVVLEGSPAELKPPEKVTVYVHEPAPPPPAPAPAPPVPAGHEKSKGESTTPAGAERHDDGSDYERGYREGLRDAAAH
jgi:hypothetical protein